MVQYKEEIAIKSLAKMGRLVLFFVFLFTISQTNAQVRQFFTVTGALGHYINTHDASLLNYYNPRRSAPEFSILYGKEKDSRLSWDVAISYRKVQYFTLAVFPAVLGQEADTATVKSRFNFVLLPANLRYSKTFNKFQLVIKAGVFAGWKTAGSEKMTSQKGQVFLNPLARASSRFPVLDAIGVQAGLEVNYLITSDWAVGISGSLLQDASEFIYKENSWPHTFNAYSGRMAGLQIKRYF